MTAGSLLVAFRSSCLQTFRRPHLLLAPFPLKVRPSRVTQKSLRVLLTVSRTVRRSQRSGSFLFSPLQSLESEFHRCFFVVLLSHAKCVCGRRVVLVAVQPCIVSTKVDTPFIVYLQPARWQQDQ